MNSCEKPFYFIIYKKCECRCEQIWNASLFRRLYYVTFVTGHVFAVSLQLNILPVMMLLARLQNLPTKKIRFHERAPAESFIARDNVATFLSWCREFGLADTCLFETDDLGKICQERVYQKSTARGSAANSVDLQKDTKKPIKSYLWFISGPDGLSL